ncbi:cytochrome P450 [Parafrankia sp. FMc6]|uniref:cytochrome P450 n=1 Tax=Parafrankia soli TaxID=2599596 RepID=UPI0034D74280
MTRPDSIGLLDRARLREVFDLRNEANLGTVAGYEEDPYPRWHELRELAAVHPGTLHELTGFSGPVLFQGLPFEDRPHFTAFTFAACDEALKNQEVFASSSVAVDLEGGRLAPLNSIFSMAGAQHRRYRRLVQSSFVPPRMAWWTEKWIETTVHALIDWFAGDGSADLNVDFSAAVPVLTITGSFGVAVEQAIAIREALSSPERLVPLPAPIIAARRETREDDLISVLVDAEVQDDDGNPHRLSDAEIYSFAVLLLMAGSGTTWRQMGIVLTALLQRPEILDAVRRDRQLLRNAIDESLRWMPTNPMFSRFLTKDVEFHGAHLPKGAVLHLALGAGSRDPRRWERPDEFDVTRPPKPSLGFGGGPHVCLGMHVARAEMYTGIGALLDRLPNLRLDPDADPPRIIGMYHRGPTAIPVLFG